MEVWLDSQESPSKRIDLSFEWKTNYDTRERRFVVTNSMGDRTSFESFIEAVEFYKQCQ